MYFFPCFVLLAVYFSFPSDNAVFGSVFSSVQAYVIIYRVIHKSLRISELDCATTKTDTAERSVSIGTDSLQVFFCTRGLGVLPGSTARG